MTYKYPVHDRLADAAYIDRYPSLRNELARQLGKLYDALDENRARTVKLLAKLEPKMEK